MKSYRTCPTTIPAGSASVALTLRLAVLIIGLFLMNFAAAHPGDTYEVTAERVNLRAGPSNDATVLTTVQQGDKLIELRREGSWVGVRVLNTGNEGWIYSELIGLVSQSRLSRRPTQASFAEVSENFATLMKSVDERLGFSVVESIEVLQDTTLRLSPSQDWLRRTGSDAHLMAAVAFYEMWKNHHGDRPVTLVLMDERGDPYLTIKDEESGPVLSTATVR